MAEVYVLIKKGSWHKNPITDKVFKMYKPFKSANGTDGHITVIGDASKNLADNTQRCRVNVNINDFEYVDENGSPVTLEDNIKVGTKEVVQTIDYEKKYLEEETEAEALARIQKTFDMFGKIVEAVPQGHIRGMIISGPPGVGKTHTVIESLDRVLGNDRKYTHVKGFASAIAIYKMLYYNSSQDNVLVFDDCDAALDNENSLNILKCALDSGARRDICWMAESRVLKTEDIPDRFEFKGGVIFLTNRDFEMTTAPSLKEHLAAMMSRCHYIDLEISSQRDQLLRIKQIVAQGLLAEYQLSSYEELMLMEFIETNFNFLRERSLRIIKKVAEIYKAQPANWREFAEMSCLKKSAKYERLYLQRKKQVTVNGEGNVVAVGDSSLILDV